MKLWNGEDFCNRDRPLSFHWRAGNAAWINSIGLPVARSKNDEIARSSIVTEAVLAHRINPGWWTSYSRNRNFYTDQQRYKGTAYTYGNVTRSVDQLAALELLEDQKAASNGPSGWQSRFRATPSLIVAVPVLDLVFDPYELIRLKDANGRLIDYRDTEATRQARHTLRAINEGLRSIHVDVAAQGIQRDGHLIRCRTKSGGEAVVSSAMQTLYRVFNRGRFTLGGRAYGGWWQGLPKFYRAHIQINGEATCEHDFEQLHPRLLYALAGKMLEADAYTIPGWERKLGKLAFNILLNAETHSQAVGALADKIGGNDARQKAVQLIDAMKARHASVAECFHQGYGLRLQCTDSNMAQFIMVKLLFDGIAALPVHDSFVVQARYSGTLADVMQEAFAAAAENRGIQQIIQRLMRKRSYIWRAGGGVLAPLSDSLVMFLPGPDQLDLFCDLCVSVPLRDLDGWRAGLVPSSVRSAVRHELRRRGLRQDDLAARVGLSRPQLTNVLVGRFGVNPAAADRIKAFVMEAAAILPVHQPSKEHE